MILDVLERADRYRGLHPLFTAAFDYLAGLTPANFPTAKTFLQGEALFVVSFTGSGLSEEEARLEDHRRYIDIHFLLGGQEEIGWKNAADCGSPEGEFDEEKDFILYADPPEARVRLSAGRFLIVWPGEAHAARLNASDLQKVVVKVRV